jgi:hypothetical protein
MSFKPLPVYSHGHFQLHCTYGQSQKKGSVPNNYKNYNDLVGRPAGGHGYFKPSFCHWPKGGYTLREAQHTHRNGELDVSPQSFEFGQYYLPEDVGVAKRHRDTDLAVMGTRCDKLTKAALDEWLTQTAFINTASAQRPSAGGHGRPHTAHARAPSDAGSEKTNLTLGIGVFSLTKGTAFEPEPKAAPWSTPSFAQYPPRPKSAGPAIQRQREREKQATAIRTWEKENERALANTQKATPLPGAKGEQSAILSNRLAQLEASREALLRGEIIDPSKPMDASKSRARARPSSAHPRLQQFRR